MGTLFLPFNAPTLISPMPADSPHSELSWFYSFGVMAWRSLVFIFPKTFGIFYVGTAFFHFPFISIDIYLLVLFFVVPIFSRKKWKSLNFTPSKLGSLCKFYPISIKQSYSLQTKECELVQHLAHLALYKL
jgi:hypothetical protein